MCRIRHSIPKEYYNSLYFALFESHLSYCITVWGGAAKNCIEKLFVSQKHCIRVLFGDLEKYLDKFNTAARVRPFKFQKLGKEFFTKEIQNLFVTRNKFWMSTIFTIINVVLKFLKFLNLENHTLYMKNLLCLLSFPKTVYYCQT